MPALAKVIAKLDPDLIVAELANLIGIGKTSDSNYILDTIRLGAQATCSTSGILKAADPYTMVEKIIYNLRKA